MTHPNLIVIGGGLAGSEAAWQAAQRGLKVALYEMRPGRTTGAHAGDKLAELVCSNSLGSTLPDRAGGVLKAEMDRLGSLILAAAEATRVPAGGALAVDRETFAATVTARLSAHPNVAIRREELTEIPTQRPVVVASGPLTSPPLAEAIRRLTGADHLYFYDALAPIVDAESINLDIAWRQSRYGRGENEDGDYINCPLDRQQYRAFVAALRAAEQAPRRDFEQGGEAEIFFEGCLPIEVLAGRGDEALAFGPMRPVGLVDPRTGLRPWAAVQLRQDNLAATLYNLVGFQTNLRWGDQERVLRMIPGLEKAEFVRLGQMHRNTFINSPALLDETLALRADPGLYFAGQIVGVEGYMGNAATGLLAGLNAARLARGSLPVQLPRETMLGALVHYVCHAEAKHFQPMKANFGILPPLLRPPRHKDERAREYAARSAAVLGAWMSDSGIAAV